MDYTSGLYTVTFPAGVTMVAFDIPISDDMILESVENFTLTINQTSLPTGVSQHTSSKATVNIVDNECKYKIYSVI